MGIWDIYGWNIFRPSGRRAIAIFKDRKNSAAMQQDAAHRTSVYHDLRVYAVHMSVCLLLLSRFKALTTKLSRIPRNVWRWSAPAGRNGRKGQCWELLQSRGFKDTAFHSVVFQQFNLCFWVKSGTTTSLATTCRNPFVNAAGILCNFSIVSPAASRASWVEESRKGRHCKLKLQPFLEITKDSQSPMSCLQLLDYLSDSRSNSWLNDQLLILRMLKVQHCKSDTWVMCRPHFHWMSFFIVFEAQKQTRQ